ncbi:MAG: hypothetical protein WCQ99_09570, partial [Pseudomonadota bacterium]
VMHESGYDEFTVYKVLYSLLSSGFVKIDERIQAEVEASFTKEAFTPEHALSHQEEDFFILEPAPDTHQLIDIPTLEPSPSASEELVSSGLSLSEATPASSDAPFAEKKEPAAPEVTSSSHDDTKLIPESLPGINKTSTLDALPPADTVITEIGPEAKQLFGMTFKRAARILASLICLLLIVTALFFLFIREESFEPSEVSPKARQLSVKANQFYEKIKNNRKATGDNASKPASLPEQKIIASGNKNPAPEVTAFQDSNTFFFLNMPGGYTLDDTSAANKTSVTFTYTPNVTITVNARPWKAEWNPDAEMYNKILEIQEGRGNFSGSKIESYGLTEFGGIKGYGISLAGYQELLFCKKQIYVLCGYKKIVFIEILCKNCRRAHIEKLFNQVKESITKSFLIYP